MGSYCPICEQFVNNLDDCDLLHDGNPSPPDEHSYDDDDDERWVINHEGQKYIVETDPDSHVIFYKNVLVEEYQHINEWLIMAKEFGTDHILFFFVKVRNDAGHLSWLKVCREFAEARFYY